MIIMNASNEHLIPCDPHNYFEMTYHFESFHCIFCCNFHPSFRMLRLFLPSFFCSLLRTDANQIIFSTFQILLFLCLRLLQNTIKNKHVRFSVCLTNGHTNKTHAKNIIYSWFCIDFNLICLINLHVTIC